MCVCVFARACVCACVRVCVCACVYWCVGMYVLMYMRVWCRHVRACITATNPCVRVFTCVCAFMRVHAMGWRAAVGVNNVDT